MGQVESGEPGASGDSQATPVVSTWLHSKLEKQAVQLKQIVTLSYEQFKQSILHINGTTSSFSYISGKELQFQIKKGTDSTIFWKGTVRVRCYKVNCDTGTIESTRLLNLKQYIHLYNEITRQAAIAPTLTSEEGREGLCASLILTQIVNEAGVENESDECCICMDRKSGIILRCSHSYCEQCFDEWNVNHKTCPICRATVDNRDDAWVLTEKPDQNEMAHETTDYLMGLADKTGTPSHSPTE